MWSHNNQVYLVLTFGDRLEVYPEGGDIGGSVSVLSLTLATLSRIDSELLWLPICGTAGPQGNAFDLSKENGVVQLSFSCLSLYWLQTVLQFYSSFQHLIYN